MGRQIVTEAQRRGNPRPTGGRVQAPRQEPRGQGISRERGSATRNKKNPGKRAHQGG